MKHLGIKGGWQSLATACLRNAIKTGDTSWVLNEEVFSTICALADVDENEIIIELKYAEHMKNKYGDKWYKGVIK